MYVAVKGGGRAISAAHAWLDETRRGDTSLPELSVAQIEQQMGLAVDRVMAEGSCHDRFLAALAIKQAKGDLIEAAFLLRAYRTTLVRFGASEPVETARCACVGGSARPTRTCRAARCWAPPSTTRIACWISHSPPRALSARRRRRRTRLCRGPRVTELLAREGLMQREVSGDEEPGDLTRQPLAFPADRPMRLQNLARGDEGFLLALGYSTQRGYGNAHPFVGEIRVGHVSVEFTPPELGFAIDIGDIAITECQMINQFKGSRTEPAQFTRGYGLVFGHGERRAMAMALVDRSAARAELGEEVMAPAQDAEFVLYHSDNIEATGFVEHLKLPHYVDFQSELENLRTIRRSALQEAAE